jgi:hypothetical protein
MSVNRSTPSLISVDHSKQISMSVNHSTPSSISVDRSTPNSVSASRGYSSSLVSQLNVDDDPFESRLARGNVLVEEGSPAFDQSLRNKKKIEKLKQVRGQFFKTVFRAYGKSSRPANA